MKARVLKKNNEISIMISEGRFIVNALSIAKHEFVKELMKCKDTFIAQDLSIKIEICGDIIDKLENQMYTTTEI